jgi:ABC-type phosphate/phosphonate transport system substrate-binding protein
MLSASNRMSADTREKIRDGRLRANETAAGQALLQALDLPRFEAVTPESFANQRNVLKSYWGY